MKISVITVCLNAEDKIERTLKSLFEQTYKDFELIVHDGGSSDTTLDILNGYKENISVLKVQRDSGVYNAMNNALKDAAGDYIFFLNAGDTLKDKDVFKNAVKKIKEAGCPDFAFGYANYTDENGSFETLHKYLNWRDKYFFVNHNICHQSIFYKTQLYFDDCYDESFKLYADWDFNARARLIKKAEFFNLDFCICNYYVDGISSSRENSKIIRKEKDIIQRRYFKNVYPLIALDKFMIKNFNSIYRPLRRFFVVE